MDVWSRGLGNRTLNLRLQNVNLEILEDGSLRIKGVMGPPVFWNFAVTMRKEDIAEFMNLINKTPDCVDFIVHSKEKYRIYSKMIRVVLSFIFNAVKFLIKKKV